jgi:hypothetical protein
MAAIMNYAFSTAGALKGHAAEGVAKTNVIGRRLKGVANGIVVGDKDSGWLVTFYE